MMEQLVPLTEIQQAIDASKEGSVLSKEIATVAAAGFLDSETTEQQKALLLIDLLKLQPIAVKTPNKNYYLLGNSCSITELSANQPLASFAIPSLQVSTSHSSVSHQSLLQHLIANSRISNILKNEVYVEMDKNISNTANNDWVFSPQSKYAVSQLFAGCILLDGTKALLINCVESYGRKRDNDSHAEQYLITDRETSIPAHNDRYGSVCVRLMNSDNSIKLIIGTFSCNLLVTSSCTIDENPVICVGPSTNSFKPSNQTQIFLNKKSVDKSLILLSDNDYCQLYPYDQMEQLNQVRSKFYREETYTKCRCASDFTKGHIYQPCSIWTLLYGCSNKTEESQARKASEIFNRIAIEVSNSSKCNEQPAVLKKGYLGWFNYKSGDIATKVQGMQQLFGEDDSIVIIGNNKLDEHLKQLAKLLVTPIQTANGVVKSRLAQKLFNNP
ncbi:hypothetical protein G6F56_005503 [Rhizopus delemar]|nr:hypothetical protein G6F56_005503 [Rhizopus delemar]